MNTDAYETSSDYSLLRTMLNKGYEIVAIYRSTRKFTTGRSLVRKIGVIKLNIDKYELDSNIIFKDLAIKNGFINFCKNLELEFVKPKQNIIKQCS